MTVLAHALQTALFDFLWQGLAAACFLWIALYLLRRGRPQVRYAVSCAVLALMMALPAVTAWRAYRAPAGISAHAASAAAARKLKTASAPSAGPSLAQRLEPWALPLWAAGVLFFSLRLVWCCWRVSLVRRRAPSADPEILAAVSSMAARLGLTRPVRVLAAALPDGPSVAGWIRPVLLLPPATVLGLTPDQLEAVLAHELAHIRRYDHLVNAAQSLIETLLFYHPAVWWVSARIRDERELCCDDLAVGACGDAVCFARALTRLERLRIAAPATVLAGTGGSLMFRVRRLVGAGPQECAPSKLSGILAFSLAVVCLAVSTHPAHGQAPLAQVVSDGGALGVVIGGDSDAPGVSVDLGGAAVLHRDAVEYPESALSEGVQGTVAVQVTLDAAGNVADAHVISGPMELRRAVMSSVFDWHFTQESAGATRVVDVMFDRAVAAAAAATSPRAVPGILGAVPVTHTVDGAPRTVSVDSGQNRVLIWNHVPAAADGAAGVVGGVAGGVPGGVQGGVAGGVTTAPDVVYVPIYRGVVHPIPSTQQVHTSSGMDLQVMMLPVPDGQRMVSFRESEVGDTQSPVHDPFLGRIVKSIEVVGLSDAVKADLLSRLPIHAGYVFSHEPFEKLNAIVKQFDEHLSLMISLGDDGDVTIRITAPGAR